LGGEGYVPKVTVSDKQRAYIENQQDLVAQASTVEGLSAAVSGAEQQVRQVRSKYRSDLENERVDANGEYQKLQQDLAKQTHRSNLLELKAPQSGIVKDLATHTVGTVVSTGTVLLSIVPEQEPLVAEVLIRNDDVGFVLIHSKNTVFWMAKFCKSGRMPATRTPPADKMGTRVMRRYPRSPSPASKPW
jgi:HlyD family secretion protein